MYYVALIVLGVSVMEFLLLPIYIKLKHSKEHTGVKIVVKGSITLIAVLFCAAGINRIYQNSGDLFDLSLPTGFKTNLLILIGMVICTIADMMLVEHFKLGMLMFLCGHICYIAYFLTISKFNIFSIVLFMIAVVMAYSYFGKFRAAMGNMRVAFTVYGIVILCTFSIGILLPISMGAYGIIPAISAVMLVISDYMLALNKIHNKKILSDLMYLGYYFTGQFFLALSVFIPAFFNL